ncbi:molybdopterin-dependent oxidoreductase [Marinobacter santoriniensis]|uniref:molybdopterin-dependent oxidoreductase n=1 Tax=Marinobacter santoriniensis TaxID=523742 RepID=UPI000345D8ED|nr:molybdopterin-dependent oxidoreductase [Marinobacter santoriniensis]
MLRLIFTAFLATFAMALQAAPKLTITTDADTVVLDRNQLEAFPQTTITTTSPYYEGTAEFSGPSLKRVLESAGLSGQSRITFQALNDYQVDADLDEVMGLDAIVATRMNGKPMSVRNRGPFWVMLPLSDRPELDSEEYHRFMVWQLNRIGLQ